jgi:hypothetical protein
VRAGRAASQIGAQRLSGTGHIVAWRPQSEGNEIVVMRSSSSQPTPPEPSRSGQTRALRAAQPRVMPADDFPLPGDVGRALTHVDADRRELGRVRVEATVLLRSGKHLVRRVREDGVEHLDSPPDPLTSESRREDRGDGLLDGGVGACPLPADQPSLPSLANGHAGRVRLGDGEDVN